MDLTEETLNEALKNDASKDLLVSTLSKNGYWVKTNEEKDTFLTEERTRLRDDVVNNVKKETWDNIDSAISDAYGIAKEANEKTTDYALRIAGNFKTKAEEAETLKSKIADLETQLKNGTGDATLKSQLEVQKAQIEAFKEQINGKESSITEYESKLFKKDAELDLVKGMRGLKFKKEIPEGVRDSYIKTVSESIVAKAERQGDKILYKENGIIILDDNQKPATAEHLLKKNLKDILDEGHKANGLGTNGGVNVDPQIAGQINLEGVKTKQDLIAAILKAGMNPQEEETHKKYEELAKELKLQ